MILPAFPLLTFQSKLDNIRTNILIMDTNRFAMTVESLVELADGMKAAQADSRPALPTLSEVLTVASPLPREALLLGLASDGLPVLLNLYDSVPGPLLLVGDAGSGKTNLLRVITHAVQKTHQPQDVQYGVITTRPDEWKEERDREHCVGIFEANDKGALEFLESLREWTHSNKGQQEFILLLIDDLQNLVGNKEAQQNLSWLLSRGPARHVWPIVTLNSSRATHVHQWLEFFRTRLFGHMDNPLEGQALTGGHDAKTDALRAGAQFLMREGNNWLPFWVPRLE